MYPYFPNGPFGNMMPYSNYHGMNLDWTIQVVKDFLDQYTHIQNVITEGLEDLEATKNRMEELLQAWYDEHSQDIANQLADALEDLNSWYTVHENYLDETLQANEAAFDEHAEQKAIETLESIPEDYTTVANNALSAIRAIKTIRHPADNIVIDLVANMGGYYNENGVYTAGANYGYTDPIPCDPDTLYSINISAAQYFNFLDSNQDFISGSAATWAVSPANAAYIRISASLSRFSQMALTADSMYYNKLDDTEKNKEYLVQDKNITSSTTSWQVLTTDWDFSQRAYVVIKNAGENSQIVDVAITQNGTLKQVYHPTVPAYGQYMQPLYYANTAGVESWMDSNKYFTNYTWGISIANPSGVKYLSASVYIKHDESPVHDELPFVNCILVNTSGTAAFKKIENAIAYAKKKFNVLTTPATVYIERGDYNLSPVSTREAVLVKGSNMINLIGEDRETTRIILTSTPALNNKIIEHGGPSKIAHLSILNLWNNDGSSMNYHNNAYCVHVDTAFESESKYDTVIEDCLLYSEAFSPIGAGLHENQNQKYINSTFIFNSADPNPSGYNQWGPIYVHTPNTAGDEDNCSLEIDNCNCYAESGTYAIALPFNASGSGSKTFADIPITIQRTIGTTTGQQITDVDSRYNIQAQSALNNVQEWNY